jgi:hypothetical protein
LRTKPRAVGDKAGSNSDHSALPSRAVDSSGAAIAGASSANSATSSAGSLRPPGSARHGARTSDETRLRVARRKS